MSNVAIIFAGGTGSRMNTKTRPKQFLELHGKPILAYTLEVFDGHPAIDGIVLVVLESWVDYCFGLVDKYRLKKVSAILAGGLTALESQKRGLLKARELYGTDCVVLIHDGVRPLVDEQTISGNIECVKAHGSAITVSPAIETIAVKSESGKISRIIERDSVEMARAPQSFYLRDIVRAHEHADEDGMDFIDSASLMQHYGYPLYTVKGSPENIKITTPNDFYTFRALLDAREGSQVFGV